MTADCFDIALFVQGLPHSPGVYRMRDKSDGIIYIGKARDLKKRVGSYFKKTNNLKTLILVSQIRSIEITVTRSEVEALLLERTLIGHHKPKYNILFKDDKSYPYIQLTGEPFSRVRFYRGLITRGNEYFGPFPNAQAASETVQELQKMFRLRTCEESVFRNRSRACLLHQMNRCTAPCVGLISPQDYALDVDRARRFLKGDESHLLDDLRQQMEQASEELRFEEAADIRDRIALIQKTLSKQAVISVRDTDVDVLAVYQEGMDIVVNQVRIRHGRHLGDYSHFLALNEEVSSVEVLEAFLSQNYISGAIPKKIIISEVIQEEEWVAWLSELAGHAVRLMASPQGEEKTWLLSAYNNAKIALEQRKVQRAAEGRRLEALQEFFGWEFSVQRIECFDISHTQGEAPVGSCVVFNGGKPVLSDYRRYNIEGVTPGDDIRSLQQVLYRRYGKSSENGSVLPDLILIDGGRGQVNGALQVLRELSLSHVLLLGIAKGEGRKPGLDVIIDPKQLVPHSMPITHLGFHLLQAIRDEAHRFALLGHRKRRQNARVHSALEKIPGIGSSRRKKLLMHFGGMRALQEASEQDIASVPGIGVVLANIIYQQIH